MPEMIPQERDRLGGESCFSLYDDYKGERQIERQTDGKKQSEMDLEERREREKKTEKGRERVQIKCEGNFWDEKEVNDLPDTGHGGILGIWERVKLESCYVLLKNAFDEAIFKISNTSWWISLK